MKPVFVLFTIISVCASIMGCDAPTSRTNDLIETEAAQEPAPRASASVAPASSPSIDTDEAPDAAPTIDTSKIKTADDYVKAKDAAWKRYDKLQHEAWKAYDDAKTDAYSEYNDFKNAELKKVRETNRQAFYDYLEALTFDEFDTQFKLEKTVPELVAFKKVTEVRYKSYEKADKKAYKRYEDAKARAYEAYEREKDAALEAYEANRK